MNVKIISGFPIYNRGLYRIHYIDKSIYVGSFVNKKGHVIGDTYFGSSRIALMLGLRLSNGVKNKAFNISKISLLEIWYLKDKETQPIKEADLILETTREFGLHPYAAKLTSSDYAARFKKGRVLNCHANNCTHLKSKIVRTIVEQRKRENGTTANGIKSRLQDVEKFKESSRKGTYTRKVKYGCVLSENARLARSKQQKENPDYEFGQRMVKFHNLSVESRKNNGSYKLGAAKVAKTIHGRDHFVEIAIRVEYKNNVLSFKSIKDTSDYFEDIGIHVTRATISQGLKRNKGYYIYKNLIKFYYEDF